MIKLSKKYMVNPIITSAPKLRLAALQQGVPGAGSPPEQSGSIIRRSRALPLVIGTELLSPPATLPILASLCLDSVVTQRKT